MHLPAGLITEEYAYSYTFIASRKTANYATAAQYENHQMQEASEIANLIETLVWNNFTEEPL